MSDLIKRQGGDLIKRQDALMALRLEYPTMPMFKELREEWAVKTEGYRKAEEVIMRLPSADRPQGEWVATDDTDEWYGPTYKCNICGSDAIGGHDNYCYNCGAQMKGADDERFR